MKSFEHIGVCPIRDIICKINSKWSMLVMATLNANGRMRFGEIQKTIGDVSQRMLTVTLRSLEDEKMVKREVYAEVPPRVEYYLTDKGKSFIPVMDHLVKWAFENSAVTENE